MMAMTTPMREEELKKLVESTSDPAFVVDGEGVVIAWNAGVQELFGITAEQAKGQWCGSIVQGTDECGAVCSESCMVQQAISSDHPLKNFDLEVQTASGKQWCNVSVLTTASNNSIGRYAIHIIRPVDLRKRLETLMCDFVINKTGLSSEQALAILASRTAARQSVLTERETQILSCLARGDTSRSVAEQLHISRTTVNNHVQHILEKLDAHTRLEAIHRAERARLI